MPAFKIPRTQPEESATATLPCCVSFYFFAVYTVHGLEVQSQLIKVCFLLLLTGGAGVADCLAEGDGRRSVWWEDEGLHLEHTQVWKGKDTPLLQPVLGIIMNSFLVLTFRHFWINLVGMSGIIFSFLKDGFAPQLQMMVGVFAF